MSEFIYKDYLPANARVIIDYSKKQKVGFSYPIEWTYSKAVWKRAYPTILGFWYMLHYGLFLLFFPYIFIGFFLYLIFFPSSYVSPAGVVSYLDFLHVGLPMVCMIIYFMGIPALITFFLSLNKDRMSRWLPKIGYYTAKFEHGTKEKRFESVDIIDNKLIIPSFSNVFLNYKTFGDFNEYLEKIEVMEIPFNYKIRKFWLPFGTKKEKNDFDFRAVFFFNKQPRKGYLDVEFI